MSKPSIVIINASLHGNSEDSNTYLLLQLAQKVLLREGATAEMLQPRLVQFMIEGSKTDHGTYMLDTSQVLQALSVADGLIIGTGTYWGQGSSTLQRFIEEASYSEGTDAWLGKPAGIIVSEHSSGGQVVLSNLMTTLSNFGCLIPPQGGMVYSRAHHALARHGEKWALDVWGLDDIASICHRLIAYAVHRSSVHIKSWIVDRDRSALHKNWVEDIDDET